MWLMEAHSTDTSYIIRNSEIGTDRLPRISTRRLKRTTGDQGHWTIRQARAIHPLIPAACSVLRSYGVQSTLVSIGLCNCGSGPNRLSVRLEIPKNQLSCAKCITRARATDCPYYPVMCREELIHVFFFDWTIW